MDDPHQAQAYAQADFSESNQLFIDTFARCFPRCRVRLAVDLGCGPADIMIRFARAHPQCTLIGVDGAAAMVALARRAVRAAGLEARIGIERVHIGRDGAGRTPAVGADAVLSNSLLHHLEDPAALWEAVKRCGRARAAVLVMDLVRPRSAAQAQAIVEHYAGDAPEVLRRDFFRSLRAAYRVGEVRRQLAQAGLEGFRVQRVSDRHLAVWGRLPAGAFSGAGSSG